MKKSKTLLSLLITAVLLFTTLLPASAALGENVRGYTRESSAAEEYAAVTLFPGSDEKDKTIAWYSREAEGYIKLSHNFKTEEIPASATLTPQGDYRLCVSLTELEQGSYSYSCHSESFSSEVYSFAVRDGDSSRVLYVSDIHMAQSEEEPDKLKQGAYIWNKALEGACIKSFTEGKPLDLIVSGGDQATEGLRSEYQALSSPSLIKSVPFATSVGNHDRKSVDYRYYTALPNQAELTYRSYIGTDYWLRQGDALFLMLDSCNCSMKDHYRFMKQATQSNPDAQWIIAVMHHDMFGGREPWLNTENTLLRLMWVPFFDEFGVDLVLYGHSHYYSVSNVIYGNKTVESTGHNASLTDPEGTVYISTGSITSHAPLLDDEGNVPPVGENAGYTRLEDETIYNLIDITEDTLTVRSCSLEADEEFNRLTIKKTTRQGGHSYKNSALYLKPVAFLVGRIVNIINNYDMYKRYIDQGYSVTLRQGLIGSDGKCFSAK